MEALEAQAELAGRAIEGEVVDQTPAKDAVKILVALYTQVPEYLPLHSKLASAYEHLKEYQKAFESYDSYIKGYEKLGYPPADLRTIRVRRDACASSARAITIAGKRTYLKDHGTCEILGPLTKGQQQRGLSRFITVSFEGDVLVLTAQTGTDSESDKILSGDLKEIYRVDPKAIDPSTIRYVNISQPEFSRDAFTIYADTVGGEKEVKCEFWRRRAAKDPPVTIHEDRNLFFMQAPDEKTAQGLVNALRELVTLNSR